MVWGKNYVRERTANKSKQKVEKKRKVVVNPTGERGQAEALG